MRLVKLTIDAFQCIEHAELEFGSALNVLFGPNDLGKSSLASAIRAVLLLPHGSTDHERFVSWSSGDTPRVSLTFSTGDHNFWRVRKSFGTGSAGSSSLDFSKDGLSFSSDAKGREVDGRLRELLRWGLRAPGGRGGARGLPSSFLTNVLLAEQKDVPAILALGLTGDEDESGRKHLTEALQALAQDPLFKSVLDQAQAKAAQAFTSTGRRSTKKGSPFQAISAEIDGLRNRQGQLQSQVNDTEGAEARVKELVREYDELSATLDQKREAHAGLAKRLELSLARQEVAARLQAAEAAQSKTQAKLDELAGAARDAQEASEAHAVAKTALEATEQGEQQAQLDRDKAKDRFEEATSEKGARQREQKRKELENQKLKKEAEQTRLMAQRSAAEEAQRLSKEAADAEQQLEEQKQQLETAKGSLERLTRTQSAVGAKIGRTRALQAFGRFEEAGRGLTKAQEARLGAERDRKSAAKCLEEADSLEKQAEDMAVPDAETLRRVVALRRQVDVADARLGGGLSVEFRPHKQLRLDVTVDGGQSEERRGVDVVSLEAERSVEVEVDDLVAISVRAGEGDARREAEELRDRWSKEGAPILEAAGATDIAALEQARREADGLVAGAKEKRREAQHLEESAVEREQSARGLDELQALVEERRESLTGQDLAELAAGIRGLGEGWEKALDQQRALAESDQANATEQLATANAKVTQLQTLVGEREKALAEALESAEKAARFPDGSQQALSDALDNLQAVELAISDLGHRIADLSHEAQSEEGESRTAVEEAEEGVKRASAVRKGAEKAEKEGNDTLIRAQTRHSELLKQSNELDIAAARKLVAEVRAELDARPPIDPPVTQAEVDATAALVEVAGADRDAKQREIDKARGGLAQVGGAVIKERKEEIDRALEVSQEREQEIEVEYEAWKLLAETLRATETTEGTHLGKALRAPLTERFTELTSGRYGTVAFGPHLEAQGLRAANESRPHDALSVGTQDQLATLFRLCIAEQLESAIILDDHLSQSDPHRIDWFRVLLRRTCQKIQIVLLTCRPEDYLAEEEQPDVHELHRDRAAGLLRAVNVERTIKRYPLSPTS